MCLLKGFAFSIFATKLQMIIFNIENQQFSHIIADGRNCTFVICNDQFPVSILDLPSIMESYICYFLVGYCY